jgi:hypothetical protein
MRKGQPRPNVDYGGTAPERRDRANSIRSLRDLPDPAWLKQADSLSNCGRCTGRPTAWCGPVPSIARVPVLKRCSYGLSSANCERGSAAKTSRAT